MKGNEMLFEIIYMLWFCGCGFSVIHVKTSKFTENHLFKRTESQEIQTTSMDKAHVILTIHTSF